jgi:transcriptional regulator with XRE-family HTH domain
MKTENLKKIREYFEYSQQEVADALGIARPSYAQIELGNRKLSINEAISLAALYKMSVDELINETFGVPRKPDLSPKYIEYLEDRVKNFYTGYGTQLSDGRVLGNKEMCLLLDNRQALASALEQIKMYQSTLNK